MVQQPPVDQGLLIIQAAITLWHTTLGRNPLAEWSAQCRDLWQNTTLTREKHQPSGIRTCNPSKRATHEQRHRKLFWCPRQEKTMAVHFRNYKLQRVQICLL